MRADAAGTSQCARCQGLVMAEISGFAVLRHAQTGWDGLTVFTRRRGSAHQPRCPGRHADGGSCGLINRVCGSILPPRACAFRLSDVTVSHGRKSGNDPYASGAGILEQGAPHALALTGKITRANRLWQEKDRYPGVCVQGGHGRPA